MGAHAPCAVLSSVDSSISIARDFLLLTQTWDSHQPTERAPYRIITLSLFDEGIPFHLVSSNPCLIIGFSRVAYITPGLLNGIHQRIFMKGLSMSKLNTRATGRLMAIRRRYMAV